MELKDWEKELLMQELEASRRTEKILINQIIQNFQNDRQLTRNEINQLQQELQQKNQELYQLKMDETKVKYNYHLAMALSGILLLSGIIFSLSQ